MFPRSELQRAILYMAAAQKARYSFLHIILMVTFYFLQSSTKYLCVFDRFSIQLAVGGSHHLGHSLFDAIRGGWSHLLEGVPTGFRIGPKQNLGIWSVKEPNSLDFQTF
mmetsp:Transcript_8531/g.11755  ORF Transcript_8531/g.11755 Transcript_8531/m.11755 type:complete len:109 (-) Transcript_8531:321-647(-)